MMRVGSGLEKKIRPRRILSIARMIVSRCCNDWHITDTSSAKGEGTHICNFKSYVENPVQRS